MWSHPVDLVIGMLPFICAAGEQLPSHSLLRRDCVPHHNLAVSTDVGCRHWAMIGSSVAGFCCPYVFNHLSAEQWRYDLCYAQILLSLPAFAVSLVIPLQACSQGLCLLSSICCLHTIHNDPEHLSLKRSSTRDNLCELCGDGCLPRPAQQLWSALLQHKSDQHSGCGSSCCRKASLKGISLCMVMAAGARYGPESSPVV